MDEIGRAGAYFWRDKARKAPHNLYSNAAKLREGAEKLGYEKSVKVPGYLLTIQITYQQAENRPLSLA